MTRPSLLVSYKENVADLGQKQKAKIVSLKARLRDIATHQTTHRDWILDASILDRKPAQTGCPARLNGSYAVSRQQRLRHPLL
jgi:hypothetical protein